MEFFVLVFWFVIVCPAGTSFFFVLNRSKAAYPKKLIYAVLLSGLVAFVTLVMTVASVNLCIALSYNNHY